MSTLFAEIERQARQLPEQERAQLAQLLLESLPGAEWAEYQQEWQQEIEARIAADERGEAVSHPAEDVFAEARALCR
jgi:putative addiction module component (TIGR02574 family)